MPQLKFGDQKSIDYARAKGREAYKTFYFHECDCEFCTADRSKCPYCKSNDEPEDVPGDSHIVKCSECGKVGWKFSWDKTRNDQIIKEFENT